jgi:hypothetical protein
LLPSPGPGCQARTGEATSIIAANNPKSSINLLNLFSFLRSNFGYDDHTIHSG